MLSDVREYMIVIRTGIGMAAAKHTERVDEGYQLVAGTKADYDKRKAAPGGGGEISPDPDRRDDTRRRGEKQKQLPSGGGGGGGGGLSGKRLRSPERTAEVQPTALIKRGNCLPCGGTHKVVGNCYKVAA